MREHIRDQQRLEHILKAIDTVVSAYQHYNWEQILQTPIIYYGFVKEIEIIGEATYMLSVDFKKSHPEVPWYKIEGMRHVLVHGYYTINPNHIKLVIVEELPKLRQHINNFLNDIIHPYNDK